MAGSAIGSVNGLVDCSLPELTRVLKANSKLYIVIHENPLKE